MDDIENLDPSHLDKEGPQYFGLIRTLWINAPNRAELEKIRDNFGAERISQCLQYKNPLGVKAAAAVLLYLSVSEAYADFFTDIFVDNVLAALNNEENVANFILITRLIRLLQTYKSFSDWILTRGHSIKENRLWQRLNDFSHHSDEDLRKETTRAVREGLRADPPPGQWSYIPDQIIEKMRLDIFWAITDSEDEALDELSRGAIEGARGDEELARLEQINRQLKADGNRKIAALEAELEAHTTEKERLQNEISQVFHSIQTLKDSLGESLSNSLSAFEPMNWMGDDSVNGLRKTIATLGGDVEGLRKGDSDLRRRLQEGALDVKAIRKEYKASDTQSLRTDITANLTTNLQALQNTLKVASVTGTENGESLPLNYSMSASLSASTKRASAGPDGRVPAWAPSLGHLPLEETLPVGWTRKLDPRTNHYYYIQRSSNKVQWTVPVE